MLSEVACRDVLERLRWPKGPVCPHCDDEGPVTPLSGSAHRTGLYVCSECRGQFTVTVGTPLAGSKLPLSAWVKAAHMLNSQKPVTVAAIQNALGVTYKTAWHMVQKLLTAVEDYKGPLPKFGATVSAHIAPSRPKTRHTRMYWRRTQARKLAGTYKTPREPEVTGALAGLKFGPHSTRAQVERTERFLRWVFTETK